MLELTADENIPLVKELFATHCKIQLLPTSQLHAANLKTTDILLTRSVTTINKDLLIHTPIQYVASPVSGTDHIDANCLEKNNIAWTVAPGCNALSVAEYVVSSIALLKKRGFFSHAVPRAAVIGVGQVGKIVKHYLEILGFEVICNDPPRAEIDPFFLSTPVEKLNDLDLICLHTPLTYTGQYPTHHLIDKNFLEKQKTGCVLLNAGRGAVINSADLYQYGKHLHWCLDVWENEPEIDTKILDRCEIATPHIAGHSIQAKWRGVEMIFNTINQYFHWTDRSFSLPYPLAPPTITLSESCQNWMDVVLTLYDPQKDDQHMREQLKKNISVQKIFDQLRREYPIRHEFAYPKILCKKENKFSEKDKEILDKLGVKLKNN